MTYRQKNQELPYSYFRCSTNKGKGAVLHTDIAKGLGQFIIQDAADLDMIRGVYNLDMAGLAIKKYFNRNETIFLKKSKTS